MNGMGDHDALALHAAAVTDLLDLRVDEQIRIATLKRALSKRRDLFVEQAGDPTDLGLRDAQAERLDELIDTPRLDAADVGLLHDRHERCSERLRGYKNDGK